MRLKCKKRKIEKYKIRYSSDAWFLCILGARYLLFWFLVYRSAEIPWMLSARHQILPQFFSFSSCFAPFELFDSLFGPSPIYDYGIELLLASKCAHWDFDFFVHYFLKLIQPLSYSPNPPNLISSILYQELENLPLQSWFLSMRYPHWAWSKHD